MGPEEQLTEIPEVKIYNAALYVILFQCNCILANERGVLLCEG
jgi:hypothetical protein